MKRPIKRELASEEQDAGGAPRRVKLLTKSSNMSFKLRLCSKNTSYCHLDCKNQLLMANSLVKLHKSRLNLPVIMGSRANHSQERLKTERSIQKRIH
jgi:hypothetical protein